LHGLDPSLLDQLNPASLQALEALGYIAQDFDVAFAQCQAVGQCAVGIVTVGPTYVGGNPVDSEITESARTSGEQLFLQANDIREYVAGLPTEQAALVMLGVQALLGPAKAAM
jgi:filamentous hemagglutinin